MKRLSAISTSDQDNKSTSTLSKSASRKNSNISILSDSSIFISFLKLSLFIIIPWLMIISVFHHIHEISSSLRGESIISPVIQLDKSSLIHQLPIYQRNITSINLNTSLPSSTVVSTNEMIKPLISSNTLLIKQCSPSNKPIFDEIKWLFELGQENPEELVKLLNNSDPFCVNIVDPTTFQCPSLSNRLPIHINQTRIDKFKKKERGYYILYQHLRKAGGTSFCELAKSNMDRNTVPPYYCMPDNRGSLATMPWNEEKYLNNAMFSHNYRIASNEWDAFYSRFHNYSYVVTATTFRNPLDRWYSQYRFEHLEHRDGSSQDSPRQTFPVWYDETKRYTMGTNYYTKTFIGDEDSIPLDMKAGFYWTYHKYYDHQRNIDLRYHLTWEDYLKAIDTLSSFSLILILEWIKSDVSHQIIDRILGWPVPPKQVLPHEVHAIRDVKKSVSVQDRLTPSEYITIAKENAIDLLFFDIAKRMFIERTIC